MRVIDLRHLDRDRVIGTWQVGDMLIDPGPSSCLPTLLEALDGERPRVLALTHIHLDHAGASGSLVRRYPDLEVWVHERGARHLVDPSRLLASATRLYGDDMDRLWGALEPVPAGNIRVLEGGERLGGLRVAHTPGHASHHVSYLHEDSGIAFTGDVTGVRIGEGGYVLPPTPPPDVDLEAWRASLDLVAGWEPRALALTHFGRHDDVARHLEELREHLEEVESLARDLDAGAFDAAIRARVDGAADASTAASYRQAMPPKQSWHGLRRYLGAGEEAGRR